MKKLLLIFNFTFLIFNCLATPVLFTTVSLTGSVNNRQILVTPDNYQNPLVIGTNLVATAPFILQPINGQVQTNLTPWGYTIKVDGWPRSAHILVPNDTAVWNAAALINTNSFSPVTIYTGTVNLSGATNLFFASGTNTTYRFAGGTNFFDSSGGGTGATNAIGTNIDSVIIGQTLYSKTNFDAPYGVAAAVQVYATAVSNTVSANQTYAVGVSNIANTAQVYSTAVSNTVADNQTYAVGVSNIANTAQVYATAVSNTVAANQTYAVGVSNIANTAQVYATAVSNTVAANQTYAVGVSNNVVNASNVQATANGSISNLLAWLQFQVGGNTNFLVTTGFTPIGANGTNVTGPNGSLTNLTGGSYLSNDVSGLRLYVAGIAAFGSKSGWLNGPWTNISGTIPGTCSFLSNSIAAGANVAITSAFGVQTISSAGSGTATNVFVQGSTTVAVTTNSSSSWTFAVPASTYELYGTVQAGTNNIFLGITNGFYTSGGFIINSNNIFGRIKNANAPFDISASTNANASSLNGTSLAGLGTGLLKNTTGTGAPTIAAAGSDYQAALNAGQLATANTAATNVFGTNAATPLLANGLLSVPTNYYGLNDSRVVTNNQVTAPFGTIKLTTSIDDGSGNQLMDNQGALFNIGSTLMVLSPQTLLMNDSGGTVSVDWKNRGLRGAWISTNLTATGTFTGNGNPLTNLNLTAATNHVNYTSNLLYSLEMQMNTNLAGVMQAANFYNSNSVVFATGFTTTAANGPYFPIATNWYVNQSGMWLFADASYNFYMSNPNTAPLGTNYSRGGGPVGSGWTVVNGAAPAGTTYYTNAPLSTSTLQAISVSVATYFSAFGLTNGQSNVKFINLGVGITPFQFGAVGDGDIFTNLSMTSGSAVVTLTGGSLKYGNTVKATDVGKKILIYGAGSLQNGPFGATTNCLSTSIISTNSATSFTVGLNALNSCNSSGVPKAFAVYGTDDTAALQGWLNYTTNFFGDGDTNDCILQVPSKIFVIAGPLVDPYSSATFVLHKNSQLQFPDYPIQGDFTKTIRMVGRIIPAPHESTYGGTDAFGSIFWSFYVNTNVLPAVTSAGSTLAHQRNVIQPAVFTSQNWTAPVFTGTGSDNYTNRFNPVRLDLQNVKLRCPANPSISGFDLQGFVNINVDNVFVDTGVRLDGGWCPVNTNVCALLMPPTFADNNSTVDNFEVNNFDVAIKMGEHVHIKSCNLQGCMVAFLLWSGGHWAVIDNSDPEGTRTLFYNTGGAFGVNANCTIEGSQASGTNWFSPTVMVNDWNNAMYGEVRVDDTTYTYAWDTGAGGNAVSKIGGSAVAVVRYNGSTGIVPIQRYSAVEQLHGKLIVDNGIQATNATQSNFKTITIEPGGGINATATTGTIGFDILDVDQSIMEPHYNAGGSATVWLAYGSGLGQTFGYGSYRVWGVGGATGLIDYTNAIVGGSLTVTNAIQVKTNGAPPAFVAGYGFLWASNTALYWVTQNKTNLIGGP